MRGGAAMIIQHPCILEGSVKVHSTVQHPRPEALWVLPCPAVSGGPAGSSLNGCSSGCWSGLQLLKAESALGALTCEHLLGDGRKPRTPGCPPSVAVAFFRASDLGDLGRSHVQVTCWDNGRTLTGGGDCTQL